MNEAIPRNKFSLFGEKAKRNPSKNAGKLKTAKQDTRLFARLYIGCQSRDGDLEDFFAHENQSSPPAISENGKLRSGTKSDLIQCLMEEIDTEDVSPKPTCVILDDAVLVQMLRPKNCKTFKDYSTSMFLPHLKSWLQKAQRVDLVWDDYFECSLKASSRESRGRGQRRRVLSSAPLPTDWQAFLRLDENKKELFAFLSIEAGSLETEGTELTKTLLNLQKLEGTSEVPDQCIQVIERFIVLLYDRTSMLSKV